jgi:hypothetical protein
MFLTQKPGVVLSCSTLAKTSKRAIHNQDATEVIMRYRVFAYVSAVFTWSARQILYQWM